MKPDEPQNQWQNNLDDQPTGMYEPLQDDSPTPSQANPDNSSVPKAEDEPIHWVANEYIHEDKNWAWFVLFVLAILALIAADIFLLKSYTFSVLVIVMAASLVIYIRRPPKQIEYTLSGDQGLYVGERLYHFNEFKSFGLIRDHDQHSILLIPLKRFSPGVSVYFPDEVGEKVVDILGARLPMDDLKLDVIDVIVRKLRL